MTLRPSVRSQRKTSERQLGKQQQREERERARATQDVAASDSSCVVRSSVRNFATVFILRIPYNDNVCVVRKKKRFHSQFFTCQFCRFTLPVLSILPSMFCRFTSPILSISPLLFSQLTLLTYFTLPVRSIQFLPLSVKFYLNHSINLPYLFHQFTLPILSIYHTSSVNLPYFILSI
jgi:hypothetical protein